MYSSIAKRVRTIHVGTAYGGYVIVWVTKGGAKVKVFMVLYWALAEKEYANLCERESLG
ncbi:MAG: hypothetical protein OXP71_13540 [Candidatus Poribacteria bacterium]|nr:hypothetical protein [Candidatus Poribacteria bacterium]